MTIKHGVFDDLTYQSVEQCNGLWRLLWHLCHESHSTSSALLSSLDGATLSLETCSLTIMNTDRHTNTDRQTDRHHKHTAKHCSMLLLSARCHHIT